MDGNWATRTVCRQCGKSAPYRIRAAAKQAHEKEEKQRSSDSSIGSGQKTIAKLEEQLKAARNENKRLVARTQHVDKSKESDGAIESADDGRGAADLDELQTLVDLSKKYFPDSLHCVRNLMLSARKSKMPNQSRPRSPMCRDDWRRNGKRKRLWIRKSLICASNSKVRRQAWRFWQLTLMSLRKSCKCCNVVQCSPVLRQPCVGSVFFNLMRESLPKQLDQRPEIAAILDDVRSGMARIFHVANEASKTITHDISSEAEFNCQEMEDVEDDGYDDCDDSVYLGGMVDKMAGECNIDRDEAVKRLGAVLQKQAKRIRIVGKQESKSNEASG